MLIKAIYYEELLEELDYDDRVEGMPIRVVMLKPVSIPIGECC